MFTDMAIAEELRQIEHFCGLSDQYAASRVFGERIVADEKIVFEPHRRTSAARCLPQSLPRAESVEGLTRHMR